MPVLWIILVVYTVLSCSLAAGLWSWKRARQQEEKRNYRKIMRTLEYYEHNDGNPKALLEAPFPVQILFEESKDLALLERFILDQLKDEPGNLSSDQESPA
jgi:hypothetical protein